MQNPGSPFSKSRYLRKSPSNDSGTGTATSLAAPTETNLDEPSPIRKRHLSCMSSQASSSPSSSSSLEQARTKKKKKYLGTSVQFFKALQPRKLSSFIRKRAQSLGNHIRGTKSNTDLALDTLSSVEPVSHEDVGKRKTAKTTTSFSTGLKESLQGTFRSAKTLLPKTKKKGGSKTTASGTLSSNTELVNIDSFSRRAASCTTLISRSTPSISKAVKRAESGKERAILTRKSASCSTLSSRSGERLQRFPTKSVFEEPETDLESACSSKEKRSSFFKSLSFRFRNRGKSRKEELSNAVSTSALAERINFSDSSASIKFDSHSHSQELLSLDNEPRVRRLRQKTFTTDQDFSSQAMDMESNNGSNKLSSSNAKHLSQDFPAFSSGTTEEEAQASTPSANMEHRKRKSSKNSKQGKQQIPVKGTSQEQKVEGDPSRKTSKDNEQQQEEKPPQPTTKETVKLETELDHETLDPKTNVSQIETNQNDPPEINKTQVSSLLEEEALESHTLASVAGNPDQKPQESLEKAVNVPPKVAVSAAAIMIPTTSNDTIPFPSTSMMMPHSEDHQSALVSETAEEGDPEGQGEDEDPSCTESFKQLNPFDFSSASGEKGKKERLYKVLVVGELGAGKTSIIKRYVHQFFSQHYRATIGVDFALKVLRWDDCTVRLQLWDIAGQERFGSMTRVYYKEAVGAFVVFDVTRSATLEAVPKWKADLDSKVALPDGRPIPTVLLANKSDQPKEGIAGNRDKMNEFCQQQGFSAWFETSAKDNINIDEAANFLVSKILEMDRWSQEPVPSDPDKVDLSANGKHNPNSSSSNCAC